MDCSNLNIIELPASIEEIEDVVFYEVPLESITIHYYSDRQSLETDTSYHEAVLRSFHDCGFNYIHFIFYDGSSETIDISDWFQGGSSSSNNNGEYSYE